MKAKKLLSAGCLALTTIAISPFAGIKPADAQEQTLAVCNTPRNSIRVYNMGGRTMMRIFNRQANIVSLNSAAQRNPNPEGITYTTRAETTYTLFVPNNGNTCSFQTSNFQPERGTVGASESSLVTTLAVCQGSRNTVRIYREAGQLRMRAFDRQRNVTWLRGVPTSQQSVSGGVNYNSTLGEARVQVYVLANSPGCNITVGNQATERGTVLERS